MSLSTIRNSLRSHVDDADVRLLRKLFEQTSSRSDGVSSDRFRADNYSQLPRITRLERGFIERNQRSGHHIQIYRLTVLALLMLNSAKSNTYFRAMEKVVVLMRKEYRQNLSKPVAVSELLNKLSNFEADDVLEALEYLTQTHIITGSGQDFPRSEAAMLVPQEGILAPRALEQVLETYAGYAQTSIQSTAVTMYQAADSDSGEQLSLMEIVKAEFTNNWMRNLPQKFHALLHEIEVGLRADQLVLPCFGLRGLVEMACYDKLGVPKKFKDAVKALVANGSLTFGQGRQVSALYRYGSSVVHSGLTPNVDDVKSAMVIIVGMLRHLYHTQAAADQLTASLTSAESAATRAGAAAIRCFAYGSNLLMDRLKARVSSAKLIGVASLNGYTLAWHKKSTDGSGKCDARKSQNPSDKVWGIVFEIDVDQKPILDEFEGLGHGYDEADFLVDLNGASVRVVAYYATAVDPELQPYDWYRDLVLAGAIEHGLPPTYIQSIRNVEARADPKSERTSALKDVLVRARKIIAGAVSPPVNQSQA